MNASGSRATAEINLEEFERRLRAAGTQQTGVEDPLSELERLVESSRPASMSSPSARVVSGSVRAAGESAEPLEMAPLRSSIDEAHVEQIDTAAASAEALRDDDAFSDHGQEPNPAAAKPVGARAGWKLKTSALALAGVAMIGGVFAFRGGVPGLPKAPPFIAAAKGPTKVQPPSDQTVAPSNDAYASLLRDSTQVAGVKVVNTEEQPVDLNAQASLANAPASKANAPADAGATQAAPSAMASATPVAATVNTPFVAPPVTPPPPMALQFPDPKPVRTVSLRPDGTPIATPVPTDAAASGESSHEGDAPKPSAERAPDAPVGAAQSSTPKLDLPTKLSSKSSARVVVAKTDTTAPGAAGETNQPLQLGASAKTTKSERAEAEPPAASARQPVDPTSATTSGGWAVQLGAPRSEAEAKRELARINAKYASALSGVTIGVHKAVVKHETIYRLRVVGLSKADAAALCARVKGDGGDCFIAK